MQAASEAAPGGARTLTGSLTKGDMTPMADSNPTAPERGPTAPDNQVELAVLTFLLHEHPDRLTIPEASRAMNSHRDFRSEDAVERAIRELVGAGLLRCEGGYIQPTRAALYFARLERLG